MPIFTATAPQSTTETARQGVAALRRAQGHGQSDGEAGGGNILPVWAPLAVYYLDADNLASTGASPSKAHQVGWRYVMGQGDSVQVVEVVNDHVASIAQGASASRLIHALNVADEQVTGSKPYEARLLQFGRAGNTVLWLHAKKGPDRFFSIDAKAHEVQEETVMRTSIQKSRLRREMLKSRDLPEATLNVDRDRLAVDQDESGG